ncbi:MAG: hypothetical protein R2822_15390, partial [Spirosomataceae bacterium]
LAVVGVTITYFFTFNFQKVTNQFTLIFMVSILTYLVATHYFPPSTSDWRHSAFVSVLRGLKRYFSQPELFLRLPVSWLLAFGTFWLVVIEEWKIKNRKQKKEKGKFGTRHAALGTQHFQLGTFLWLFLSVVGGGDTTRILFNGMPFVLTFLLLRLNQKPVWVSVYVLATSLPLMRLFSLEPDLGLHPQATQAWCVECWYFWESWPYWAYATFVLTGYYYLARRLGVGSRKTNEVESRR